MKKFLPQLFGLVLGIILGSTASLFIRCHDLMMYIAQNKGSVLAFTILAFTAAVKVAPPPGTAFDLYTFLYDWTHQFLNMPNNRLNPVPALTPPLPAGAVTDSHSTQTHEAK